MLIWSFNFIAAKIGLRHMDVMSFASIRMPLAALLMLPVYFAQPRRTPLDRRDIWVFAVLGFFGVIVNSGCFVLGLTQTTSEHSVIVRALGPVLVLALAVALALEKLTPAKAAGMLISFIGVILLETAHGVALHSPLLLGDLYTFLSIAGFAFYTVFAKRIAMRYDAVAMNTYMVCAAGLMATPVALRQAIHLQWESPGWIGWAAMFYMALITTVVSYNDLQLGAAVYRAVARGSGQLRSAGGRDPHFDPAAGRAPDQAFAGRRPAGVGGRIPGGAREMMARETSL
jgi:drug/metabolite transporter (DMT)-like permease